MSEKRDNSGTIGKNERREKDTHPTHTGQCLIDGTEYWISAWVKEGRTGKFFSLAFKPKEQQQRSAPIQRKPLREELDDEIPF